jgi:hypothetical protein
MQTSLPNALLPTAIMNAWRTARAALAERRQQEEEGLEERHRLEQEAAATYALRREEAWRHALAYARAEVGRQGLPPSWVLQRMPLSFRPDEGHFSVFVNLSELFPGFDVRLERGYVLENDTWVPRVLGPSAVHYHWAVQDFSADRFYPPAEYANSLAEALALAEELVRRPCPRPLPPVISLTEEKPA